MSSNKKQKLYEVEPVFMYISATSLAMTAYRMYKDYLTKAARHCDSFEGRDKSLCMTKYKLEGLKKRKEKLEEDIRKCAEARDQQKCEESLKKKINKLEQRITKLKNKYRTVYRLAKRGSN